MYMYIYIYIYIYIYVYVFTSYVADAVIISCRRRFFLIIGTFV